MTTYIVIGSIIAGQLGLMVLFVKLWGRAKARVAELELETKALKRAFREERERQNRSLLLLDQIGSEQIDELLKNRNLNVDTLNAFLERMRPVEGE